ncbi:MAG: hypothetical protein RL095_1507 [Verrucomicrobiota bacterium]|jgi:hypothetical protein
MRLGFCMNIFPGETLEECLRALRGPCREVKSRFSPGAALPVGLRLGALAVKQALADLPRLEAALREEGLAAFTVNAFPYGTFHGVRVKEQVYLPDWSDRRRLDYSIDCARILAALLPEGGAGSISTVPLGYGKGPLDSPWPLLHEAAAALARLEEETGRRIVLALEPEPDCRLETCDEALDFFASLPDAPPLRRHLGICLDTCHAALQFEDPLDTLRRLLDAGIAVPKIQVSSALQAGSPAAARLLQPYAEGVYLHQTRIRQETRTLAFPDLPEALLVAPAGLWRSHYHVPLYMERRHDGLDSTSEVLTPEFFAAAAAAACDLETETYTFEVLPGDRGSVSDCLARELEFVRRRLPAPPFSS